MPQYEYECPRCGERVTKTRKVEYRDVAAHYCGEADGTLIVLRRIFTPPTVVFRGDRWADKGGL